jgi:DNA-binding GntR family transcriptional regulator
MALESAVDYAKKFIEDAIIRNELTPGARIKEEEIASRLGISRPPIRQAFEILVTEGLVSRKPRCGVFVSELTRKDIWEIYTLKSALYGLATTLAIDEMTDELLAELEDVVLLMEKCVTADPADVAQYQVLNESFHTRIILDAVGHKRLQKLIGNLNNQAKRLSYKTYAEREHLLSNCRFHRRILEAIRNKDKQLALALCQEHIFEGMELLQRYQSLTD